jgi:hypothetical protein
MINFKFKSIKCLKSLNYITKITITYDFSLNLYQIIITKIKLLNFIVLIFSYSKSIIFIL